MKKFSLLIGTLGGAMAGYVFSNSKLRDELSNAKDAEAAGKILAKHLAKDGKQVGSEMKRFVQSPEVKDNLAKAKQYVQKSAKKLRSDLNTMVKKGMITGKKAAKGAAFETKTMAKKAVKKTATKASK